MVSAQLKRLFSRRLLIAAVLGLLSGAGSGLAYSYVFHSPTHPPVPAHPIVILSSRCLGDVQPRVVLSWRALSGATENQLARTQASKPADLPQVFVQELTQPFQTYSYVDEQVQYDQTYTYQLETGLAAQDTKNLVLRAKVVVSKETCK